MPKKQQRIDKRPMSGQSANLGQTEAKSEKLGKEQMSHMEGSKTRKPDNQRLTKRGTQNKVRVASPLNSNSQFASVIRCAKA